jgi:hypothetical protein
MHDSSSSCKSLFLRYMYAYIEAHRNTNAPRCTRVQAGRQAGKQAGRQAGRHACTHAGTASKNSPAATLALLPNCIRFVSVSLFFSAISRDHFADFPDAETSRLSVSFVSPSF